MNQTETESDHPTATHIAADDVLERHVNNGHGDERLDERRKPQSGRPEVVSGRDQRDGVSSGECCYHCDKRPKSTEWDHQTKQKQEMVRSLENVQEAKFDEMQGGLMPSGIEPDDSRIIEEFERAYDTGGRKKTQNRDNPQSQSCESRSNRKR